MIFPVEPRKKKVLADLAGKVQHLIAAGPLLSIGFTKLRAGTDLPMALLELFVGAAVFGAFLLEWKLDRRPGSAPSRFQIGWVDLAAGVLLIVIAIEGHRQKAFYTRATFYSGLATLIIGIFHGPLERRRHRRRFLRLDETGVCLKPRRFRRIQVAWSELAHVEVEPGQTVLHRTDGRTHVIEMKLFHDASSVQRAIGEHAALAGVSVR